MEQKQEAMGTSFSSCIHQVSLTFGAPVVTMNVHPPALANVSPEVIQARINLEERSLSPACPSVRGRGRLVQYEHVSNGASLGHVVLSVRRGRRQRCTFTCDIAHIIVGHRIGGQHSLHLRLCSSRTAGRPPSRSCMSTRPHIPKTMTRTRLYV